MGKEANVIWESDYDDEGRLTNPARIYDHIESWWGDDFDDRLVDRIVNAPTEHQTAFLSSIEPLQQTEMPDLLPAVSHGILRPVLAVNEMKPSPVQIKPVALRLLLYAHEVVLDSQEIYSDFNPDRRRVPVSRAEELKLWVRMRPFVEDGSVKLAPLARPNQTVVDDVEKLMASPAIQVYLERMWAEIQPAMPYVDDATRSFVTNMSNAIGVERLVGFAAFRAVSGACELAALQKAHTLALDVLDQVVLRNLVQRPMIDRRHIDLQKLAAFKVPSMTGDVNSLVELRQSSADFAEWRTRLGEAMSYVGDLGENEASVDDAAEVVHAQLSDGLSQVEKAVKKSPALQAMKGGITGFAISGISSMTTEVLLGNPSVGLVAAASAAGAGAGMVVDSGLSYLKALQARRKGRLIMDVSMLFDPEGPQP